MQKNIVFVEGIDNTGKTELINYFMEHLESPKFDRFRRNYTQIDIENKQFVDGNFKTQQSFIHEYTHSWLYVYDLLSQIDCNIIFDRCFISEYAYGTDDDLLFEIGRKFSELNAKVIFCTHPDAKSDPEVQPEIRYNAILGYRTYFRMVPLRVINIPACMPIEKRFQQMHDFIFEVETHSRVRRMK